jgi:(1->4)-alpha-D-glucan 1-alpha-D-glucosylmutase
MRLPENISEAQRNQHVRFVMRFQQCTGPVMAKGLEDTALYLYHRLIALNEVGGNPEKFGITTSEFHRLNTGRSLHFPQAMLTTSTHDTKRSEDVRMRIAALSEFPEDWRKGVTKWMRMNRKFRTCVDDDFAPSPNEEYLLYQTLVGAWPIEAMTPELRSSLIERIQAYMLKALKEGKVNSSWVEPNEDWENAVSKFIANILDETSGAPFQREFLPLVDKVFAPGMWNSLSETVLKCTCPGVPDIYQGTDLWDFSLVDPDNRQPVDYNTRTKALDSIDGASPAELINDWKSGRIKLNIIRRLLRFRRNEAAFFRQADYQGLEVSGSHAEHCVAFLRSDGESHLLVITSRLTASIGGDIVGSAWGGTTIHLPDTRLGCEWHEILSDTTWASDNSDQLSVASMLKHYPFAVAFMSAGSR